MHHTVYSTSCVCSKLQKVAHLLACATALIKVNMLTPVDQELENWLNGTELVL